MKPIKNILVACTGSVATIKLSDLVQQLHDESESSPYAFQIRIILTEHAKHFVDLSNLPLDADSIYDDSVEWGSWSKRGDPVLHIDLGKWADVLLIAPLSANSLAKIATGICDNLVMCTIRAWDCQKPLLFCPAMNSRMYEHPITAEQIEKLKSWGYHEIPSISKKLMCGDVGVGAMAEVPNIVKEIISKLK